MDSRSSFPPIESTGHDVGGNRASDSSQPRTLETEMHFSLHKAESAPTAFRTQHTYCGGVESPAAEAAVTGEVHMRFTRISTVRPGANVISGILNCVCPECGGRMGGRGKEFRCQGECLTDWRQAWEQALAELGARSKRPARQI